MHSFYFWSCSLKVLIFYLEWKFINRPWKPVFLSCNFKIQLFNLGPSVWNAPESIGKWSRQQNRCLISLKSYEISVIPRQQMWHEIDLKYMYMIGHLVWRSHWPLYLRQLGDILMDHIMYLVCIFLLLLCSGASLYSQSCLTFFKDSQVKTPFCEIDRCIRIFRLWILTLHMVAYSSNLLKSIAAV